MDGPLPHRRLLGVLVGLVAVGALVACLAAGGCAPPVFESVVWVDPPGGPGEADGARLILAVGEGRTSAEFRRKVLDDPPDEFVYELGDAAGLDRRIRFRNPRDGPGNTRTWSGAIDGDPGSYAVFVRYPVDGGSRFEFRLDAHDSSGTVTVARRGRGGRHLLQIFKRLPGSDLDLVPLPDAAPQIGGQPHALDAATTIDVLVLYTPETLAGAGGFPDLEADVAAGERQMNDALEFSNVTGRIHVVHMEEYSATETDTALQILTSLQQDPAAHELRDETRADLVTLIVEGPTPGVAYLLAGDEWPDWAYSVVPRKQIELDYAFAHELAHNLGCCHEPGWDGKSCLEPPPDAHGWQFDLPNGKPRRTIMAYPPGGLILQYSSPDLTHSGIPTGEADVADCARVLRRRLPIIADWR